MALTLPIDKGPTELLPRVDRQARTKSVSLHSAHLDQEKLNQQKHQANTNKGLHCQLCKKATIKRKKIVNKGSRILELHFTSLHILSSSVVSTTFHMYQEENNWVRTGFFKPWDHRVIHLSSVVLLACFIQHRDKCRRYYWLSKYYLKGLPENQHKKQSSGKGRQWSDLGPINRFVWNTSDSLE